MQATTPSNPDRRRGALSQLTFWIFCVLALYLLSPGPAAKLFEHDLITLDQFNMIYAPLSWPVNHCKPIEQFYSWYLHDVWQFHFDVPS
jgi:hypothetical protein